MPTLPRAGSSLQALLGKILQAALLTLQILPRLNSDSQSSVIS